MPVSGGIEWVMVVNLIIWTGLFLYLRRLDRQVRALETTAGSPAIPATPATPATGIEP
jgi:CcmD family protein